MRNLISFLADVSITRTDLRNLPQNSLTETNVDNILQLVFAVAGAIAVLVITIGGLKYVLSQGNPQSAAQAKDTILYALVGLVLTIVGYGIVTFVIGNL